MEQHVVGLSVTVLLHLGLGLAVVTQDDCGWLAKSEADSDSKFKDARVIQAGLARKKVEPKSKQPQKKKKKKFKPPEGVKVARNDAKVKTEDDKNKPRPDPDEIDVTSILEKNRVQEPDLSTHGVDEVPVEGSTDGSEWGTEKEAKGDPYVGELKGRIYSVWQVPTLETGAGKAVGCVRLDDDGKIVDSELKKRSKNSNLNRSVTLALKKAPAMESPVPGKLKELLTERGICFEFTLDQD
jgi:hypothetical protein